MPSLCDAEEGDGNRLLKSMAGRLVVDGQKADKSKQTFRSPLSSSREKQSKWGQPLPRTGEVPAAQTVCVHTHVHIRDST